MERRDRWSPRGLDHRMSRLSVGGMARQGLEDLIRAKLGRIRAWRMTSLGRKRPPPPQRRGGLEFTLMTYNVLSQTALDCHAYLYSRCGPQFLKEEYRLSRLLPELLSSRSDVVCLQEVEQRLFDASVRPALDAGGFGAVFKRRSGGKSDGCAILWRRSKFRLLRHQEVELNRREGALDRDNVGLIAVLRPRCPGATPGAQLHVATTHLLFNPRRGDVKLCQLRLLLAELERSAFRCEGRGGGRLYHPTVLCGDFNLEPGSPLYRFLVEGRLDLSGLASGDLSGQRDGRDKGGQLTAERVALDAIGIDASGRFGADQQRPNGSSSLLDAYQRGWESDSSSSEGGYMPPSILYHPFNFVPAYKFRGGGSVPVTSMTGRDCSTVDHIFYHVKRKSSTAFAEGRLKLLGVLTLPDADALRDLGGLPNAHLGSDHLCLMAKFLMEFEDTHRTCPGDS